MKFLYLSLDLGAVIVPLIFSFHKKIQFHQYFNIALLSIFLVAFPLIVWDAYFTKIEVWGFNPLYLTGIELYNLPIEEVLFFVCIPFSCLFTYFVFHKYIRLDRLKINLPQLIRVLGILLVMISFLHWSKLYTFWTFLICGLLLVLFSIKSPDYLPVFVLSYMVLLVPFFIINGILTGTGIMGEVVWYNNTENLGIRILSIPIEDFFYGMIMILGNIILFETFRGYKINSKSHVK
ncbi:MAG: lycopene cyclase domain-containing protein [Flavobacteriales bacterium]|nr:lycopene cyclase domain-containing protein [Flavobacteriales bacterium]